MWWLEPRCAGRRRRSACLQLRPGPRIPWQLSHPQLPVVKEPCEYLAGGRDQAWVSLRLSATKGQGHPGNDSDHPDVAAPLQRLGHRERGVAHPGPGAGRASRAGPVEIPMPSELVGVAGFEPAASSSRSRRARSPTTALTLSDLPRTVRRGPLTSACVCGCCFSVSYLLANGAGASA